ncbi:hypothetical protein [Actinoplanes sp. L3-i22]|uniref:hypothetical protein n=1 Tax=Actinoplanes sp. L3-i22 TaxID=2836373 RepID=UPI001C85F844|nr:hypothetical protein [Actinoplanes sp. L3-i22]
MAALTSGTLHLRAIFTCLLAGIFLATGSVVFADKVSDEQVHSEIAASRIGVPFIWPDGNRAADPEVALRILAEASEATASNVLRTTVGTAASGRTQITHYIFMSRNRTRLFDDFTLGDGRWLTPAESRSSEATVSSARVGSLGNVGVPAVVAHRYDLTFAPLRQAFDSLPTVGQYVIEPPDRAIVSRFLAIVRKLLIEAGVQGLTMDDLTAVHVQAVPGGTSPEILAYVLAGLATLVATTLGLREGKRIGVLRLMGHSGPRIWYLVVGRLQLSSTTVALCACLVASSAVADVDVSFLRTLGAALVEVAALGFAATAGVGLLLIRRIHIVDLVKGSLQ